MDFSIGSLAYWAVGFGIMFGATTTGWFGTSGFFLSDFSVAGNPLGTCILDVSGRVCSHGGHHRYWVPWPNEQNSRGIYYSALISGLIYPVFGSWAWGSLFNGSGWLEGLGLSILPDPRWFTPLAAGRRLAGAIVLGPRMVNTPRMVVSSRFWDTIWHLPPSACLFSGSDGSDLTLVPLPLPIKISP